MTVSETVELDVRDIIPRQRHPMIFQIVDALTVGQTLVLTNDHDPAPLYYQLEGTRPDQFRWEYLEEGPEVWRVGVTRKTPTLAQQTLSEIVAEHPETRPTFDQYGLDMCCGGGLTLSQAAAAHQIPLPSLMDAIQTAIIKG